MAAKPITENQAAVLLTADLARYEKAVLDAVTLPLKQYEFDALVSLVFNIGVSAFRTSTVVRHLSAGDRAAAAAAFSQWNKARVGGSLVVLPGLVARRLAERRLFEGRTGQ
jgi:lysozyme